MVNATLRVFYAICDLMRDIWENGLFLVLLLIAVTMWCVAAAQVLSAF